MNPGAILTLLSDGRLQCKVIATNLFHVPVAGADRPQQCLQGPDITACLFWGPRTQLRSIDRNEEIDGQFWYVPHVGFGHYFHETRARSIEVYGCDTVPREKHGLPCVLEDVNGAAADGSEGGDSPVRAAAA